MLTLASDINNICSFITKRLGLFRGDQASKKSALFVFLCSYDGDRVKKTASDAPPKSNFTPKMHQIVLNL